MRLQRGTLIAGLDPELARSIARACRDHWSQVEEVARRLHLPIGAVEPNLTQLTNAGYLERREEHYGPGTGAAWNTTLSGNALTMASFLKPISRARAQQLLAGVLDRAAVYNADEAKPFVITEISVFGSFLRPEASDLGDIDLAVRYQIRRAEFDDPDRRLEYARASGRAFPTFFDQLAWPAREVLRTLRNRSGYINIHEEDVSEFTECSEVVFALEMDSPDDPPESRAEGADGR